MSRHFSTILSAHRCGQVFCPWARSVRAAMVVASVLLACGGCAGSRAAQPLSSRSEIGARNGGQQIMPDELDELTRAFADRYVGLLSSTCDALKKDNPDPVQRREAQ